MTTDARAVGSNRLPELAAQIKDAHAGVEAAAKTAAERAIEAGHALLEAKALLKHGQWLPWLKEHCELPQRTAQFYMKIAKLGLKSATVALLGLKATARAVEIHMPDPFAETPSEQMREWLLYSLFSLRDWPAGWPLEELGHQMEWLKRNGWNLPSEWLGEEGDAYRKRLGMRPPPKKVKRAWEKFLADAGEKSFADVEAEWLAATQGTTPHPRPEEKSQ